LKSLVCGYNKVFGFKDGKQILLDEFGIYQEALLFAEQIIELINPKMNLDNKSDLYYTA